MCCFKILAREESKDVGAKVVTKPTEREALLGRQWDLHVSLTHAACSTSNNNI